MPKARRIPIVAIALAALLSASCNEAVAPSPRRALAIVSGDAQATLPGGRVPRALVVRAFDANGAAREGVVVRWTAKNGSTLLSNTTRTDASGVATAIWQLGTNPGKYTVTVEADSLTSASFTAQATDDAVTLEAVPATLNFTALDDTATIRIRVRSAQIDTLVDPNGWGSSANPVAFPVYDGSRRMVLKSLRNGTMQQFVAFGTVTTPFTVIVKQVAANIRIVRLGTNLLTPDTIALGPDTALTVGVVSVDKRGQPMQDSSAHSAVTWQATNPSVASVENGIVGGTAVIHGVADGVGSLTALDGARTLTSVVRVWTMRATAVVAGGGSTCALVHADSLACWGFRNVGNNSELNTALAPERRVGGPFVTLSMSDNGACGLTSSGAAWCWGLNGAGQLGIGSPGPYVPSPVAVSGGISFVQIGTAGVKSCGLTAAGKVFCWGTGFEGQLGDGTYGAETCGNFSCATTPSELAGGHTFTRVSVGGSHACALTAESRAFCWGSNRYGQLGSARVACAGFPGGNVATGNSWCSTVPVEVEGGHLFKSLAAGGVSTCGITSAERLFCWGSNLNGVIGVPSIAEGGNTINAQPLAVAPDIQFSSIELGDAHACAIDTSGSAWCWGTAFLGKLGTGTSATGQCVNGVCERAPVPVAGGLLFMAIAVGVSHTCGLTTSGLVYCWGWGGSGALGTGALGNQPTPTRVVFQKP